MTHFCGSLNTVFLLDSAAYNKTFRVHKKTAERYKERKGKIT